MGGCSAREATRAVVPERIPPRATDFSPVDRKKNLESYYLFWLDTTARSPEMIEALDELREIINYVKIFESTKECQDEVRRTANGKIFLIANLTQGLSLLTTAHDHSQLDSVYLYDSSNNTDRQEKQFNKIRGIYESFSMAKRYLEDDVKLHADFDDPMVMDFAADKSSEIEYREKFNLFLQTVNVSARDIYDEDTRARLVDLCSKYYDGNEQETSFLEQFDRTYKAEQALVWYMRGSCLHRLLCRAFLEQDMSILVDMYSFIADIDRNIRKSTVKKACPVHLYRGQLLSNEEHARLKNNLHQVVTMQCFLMGQTSRDEASRLLQNMPPSSANVKRVLFDIEATTDYSMIGQGANTSALFKLGSTFRVVEVTETTIKLSQYPSAHCTNADLINESPSIIRGLLTYLKSGPAPAVAYFQQILADTSNNDFALRSSIYGQLGFLHQQLGDHSAANKMYGQSLDYGARQFSSYFFYLDRAAQYHGTIAGNWEKAKAIWLQKLSIQRSFASEEEQGRTYENLARAALESKQYAESVEYFTSAMKGLPVDHPHLLYLQQQLDKAKAH